MHAVTSILLIVSGLKLTDAVPVAVMISWGPTPEEYIFAQGNLTKSENFDLKERQATETVTLEIKVNSCKRSDGTRLGFTTFGQLQDTYPQINRSKIHSAGYTDKTNGGSLPPLGRDGPWTGGFIYDNLRTPMPTQTKFSYAVTQPRTIGF